MTTRPSPGPGCAAATRGPSWSAPGWRRSRRSPATQSPPSTGEPTPPTYLPSYTPLLWDHAIVCGIVDGGGCDSWWLSVDDTFSQTDLTRALCAPGPINPHTWLPLTQWYFCYNSKYICGVIKNCNIWNLFQSRESILSGVPRAVPLLQRGVHLRQAWHRQGLQEGGQGYRWVRSLQGTAEQGVSQYIKLWPHMSHVTIHSKWFWQSTNKCKGKM